MKFGIHITAKQPIHEIVKIYQEAEDIGISYGYFADEAPSYPFRDPYVMLAALGYGTKTMKLGSAIHVPYTRHPALLAYAVKSYDELFPGRIMMGIGPGGVLSLKPLGIPMWNKPLTAMRETIEICRQLFAGEEVTYSGKIFQLNKTKLYDKPSTSIPILMAARGPKMLQLAGEIADGTLCNLPPETIDWAKSQIEKGLKLAKRSWNDFELTNRLPFSIASSHEAAAEAVKPFVSSRIAYAHEKTHELTGLNQEDLSRLKEAMKDGWTASSEVVTDEMVHSYANVGTPEELIERLASYQKKGIRQYIFSPPFGPDRKEAFELLRTKVIPALAE